jgi:hypothetical protein
MAGATLVALASGAAPANITYREDFQHGAGPEWSARMIDMAPFGGQRILGQFGNQTVRLKLPEVREGDLVRLAFDFCAIRTWDGNGPGAANSDRFSVSVGGGPTLLSETFSVGDVDSKQRMSYGASFGGAANRSRWGAIANDSLGYPWKHRVLDATWRFSFEFLAPVDGLELRFTGSGLQELSDESWGLDNVKVDTVSVPAHGSMALLGAGTVIMCRRRRR